MYNSNMKKLLLILTSLAIIIAIGLTTLAVIYRYDNIRADKALQESQRKADIDKTVAQAKQTLEDDIAALKQDYNALHAECLKGAGAYPLLTAANKAKVEVASCGLAK